MAVQKDWRADPPLSSTAQLGDGWVESSASLALLVPSVVIPVQHNLLINPAHRYFERAQQMVRNEAFDFDPRFVKI